MILHERDIAFSLVYDNKIGSVFCEGSFTREYQFEQIILEKHRAQQTYAYVLTSTKEIIIFDMKLSASGSDANKCSTIGRFMLPSEIESPLAIASLRGAILV